jgi:hypothetical protein
VYAFSTTKSNSSHSQHHFNVPPEILSSDCSCKKELILAVRLALDGKHFYLVLRASYEYDMMY